MLRSILALLLLACVLAAPLAHAAEACAPIPFDLVGKDIAEARKRLPKLAAMGKGFYQNKVDFYCLSTDILFELADDRTVDTLVVMFLGEKDPKEASTWKVLAQKLESAGLVSRGKSKYQGCDAERFKGPAGKVMIMGHGENCPLQVVVERR